MKKHLIAIGMTLVLFTVGFSGCVSNNEFIENLDINSENIKTSLGNINFLLWQYDNDYDWSILMNYLTFTESMLIDMEEYESDIIDEKNYLDDYIIDYQDVRDVTNINGLTDKQRLVYNEIETMIEEYDSNKSSIELCLSNMETYRKFLNLTRIKLQKLENFESKSTLMNFKVEAEEYEEAKEYLGDMIQIIIELGENEALREELGIREYSEELSGICVLWVEVWGLYDEYLDLLIDKKYSQANNKYDEYSAKYDDAFEIESSETITEINSEVSGWYQNNIGTYSDLFEEYYG